MSLAPAIKKCLSPGGQKCSSASGYEPPILTGGKVLVGTDDGELVAFTAGREKKCLGRFELSGAIYHAPVVIDNLAYIASGEFLWKMRLPK